MKCRNCQYSLVEKAPYCAYCGQSTADLNRPFLSVVKEAMHELLDIDNKLWLTLKTLIIKPGELTKEFSQGKRAKYTPPLRLYLVISIVFFILFTGIYEISGNSQNKSAPVGDYYAKAMFVLFPVFALLVQLFFKKSFYIYNLVFSMHIHSFTYLCLILIAPLEAFERTYPMLIILQPPLAIYLAWYIFTAFKSVFDLTWPSTIMKASAIYLIYMAVLGIVFDAAFAYIV